MEYPLAKKKLETLIAGMKRDLVKYAKSPDASEGALFKRKEIINTIIIYYNAAEEMIGQPSPMGDAMAVDQAFERAVLAFFDIDQEKQKHQVQRFRECCTVLHNASQLEWFKTQFFIYKEFKELAGFRHGFYSYLGTPGERFNDGHWTEAWDKKLAEAKGKIKPAAPAPKETAIERRNRQLLNGRG